MCLKIQSVLFFWEGVEGETKGERDILLKIEKLIGFPWLAH